ncbi:MAG TPA: protein phosphatase 2C domain-containing protein [Candidatus Binataceae bacterium]|nr:protein phosphatase 2C domain-containing protein [Candidatus Binataceae bacterium]
MDTEPLSSEAPRLIRTAAFELALLSDIGSDRPGNEDFCGHLAESDSEVVFAVADGVGGYEGGEVASSMAVELALKSFAESPATWGPAKRLHRAVQRANIEIHNRALAVPELRRMATTMTAAVVTEGTLHAAHVGDCRLYVINGKKIRQITKDHTMVAERVRVGMLTAQQARRHPERSALSRCLGRELIASVDLITLRLEQGSRVILCSDGLHGVLEDHELEHLTRDLDAASACRQLIDAANRRGTADNLTAAVFVMIGAVPPMVNRGWGARLGSWFSRR